MPLRGPRAPFLAPEQDVSEVTQFEQACLIGSGYDGALGPGRKPRSAGKWGGFGGGAARSSVARGREPRFDTRASLTKPPAADNIACMPAEFSGNNSQKIESLIEALVGLRITSEASSKKTADQVGTLASKMDGLSGSAAKIESDIKLLRGEFATVTASTQGLATKIESEARLLRVELKPLQDATKDLAPKLDRVSTDVTQATSTISHAKWVCGLSLMPLIYVLFSMWSTQNSAQVTLAEIKTSLADLKTSVGELKTATEGLKAVAGAAKDVGRATDELKSVTTDAQKAAATLRESAKALSDGLAQRQEALSDLKTAVGDARDAISGLKALVGSTDNLKAAALDAQKAASALKEGTKTLNDAMTPDRVAALLAVKPIREIQGVMWVTSASFSKREGQGLQLEGEFLIPDHLPKGRVKEIRARVILSEREFFMRGAMPGMVVVAEVGEGRSYRIRLILDRSDPRFFESLNSGVLWIETTFILTDL
jgi:predicted  nucleic acid-binding Zn-ribbon protein